MCPFSIVMGNLVWDFYWVLLAFDSNWSYILFWCVAFPSLGSNCTLVLGRMSCSNNLPRRVLLGVTRRILTKVCQFVMSSISFAHRKSRLYQFLHKERLRESRLRLTFSKEISKSFYMTARSSGLNLANNW